MRSRRLQKEISKALPKGFKQNIRLAAFGAMIAIVEQSPGKAMQLQGWQLLGAGGSEPSRGDA